MNKFSAGDKVSHQGHIWIVVYQDGGLVRIKRHDVGIDREKMVRLNQVRAEK